MTKHNKNIADMHEDELWQVYADNGSPIPGDGRDKDIFNSDRSLIMGNAHVWCWKKSIDGVVYILLQRRSYELQFKPGWFHISAAGHINVGETSLQAARREAKEELGVDIDPDALHFSFSTRIIGRAPNDIVTVYLYELSGEEGLDNHDSEVESYEWCSLGAFRSFTKDPESHHLINQGRLYFDSLISSIEYVALSNNILR